jgi:putative FmdB family regulatory protein
MPIYEYRCGKCGRRTSVFVRSMSADVRAACEHCGSRRLSRLVSRVTVVRSGGGGDFDDIDDRMMAGVDENDPRSVARWARRMRDEMGEEMGPDFDQALEQMEGGQFPEEDGDDDWMGDE